jgi:type II secretory pathway pseudopilin PulG
MGGRYWLWLGARLLVAIAIVGWAASYLFPGGSGEKEFQRSLGAMKQVRAVRAATLADATSTQHIEMSWDLVCAQDAFHYKWHLVESDPEKAADIAQEEIHVGFTSYEHKPDDSWTPGISSIGSTNPSGICKMLAQGSDSRVLPDLATMIKRGIIQKGDKKTVNGVRCREWNVTMKGGPSHLEHDTVCLGLDDRLPYESTVDWQHARTTYSDYNASFQIELPAAALQAASTASSSN